MSLNLLRQLLHMNLNQYYNYNNLTWGLCQTDSVTYVRKLFIVLSAKVREQKQLWLNIWKHFEHLKTVQKIVETVENCNKLI